MFLVLIAPKQVLSAALEGFLVGEGDEGANRLFELVQVLFYVLIDLVITFINLLKIGLPDESPSLLQHTNQSPVLVAKGDGCHFYFS